MLSVIVVAADATVPILSSPEAVVRTLRSIVPAVVAGVVRDVTLAALAGDRAMADIADHAGCELALADQADAVIPAGLARARGPGLLVIRAGFAVGAGFIEEVGDLLERGGGVAVLRAESEGFLSRLAPDMARVQGVILPRSGVVAGARDIAGLARGVGRAPTLRTRLRRAT